MASKAPYPWSLPVPLKSSRFEALDPYYAAFNIETDLQTMSGFGMCTHPESMMIGYADLQVGGLAALRLGNGRSCHYRGKYVKGIGRTQLAGNWADPEDVYHHSGHLLPSGALREWVVTRYLESRGLVDAIVPCQSLLLAPLAPALHDFHRKAFPAYHAAGASPLALDRKWQALTVKPSGFARFSNFSWMLNNWGSSAAIPAFFRLLGQQLGCPESELGRLGPEDLAQLLAQAVDRGVKNFARYFSTGIFWGSFYNNFTLDGRFIDLEIPLIFGRPFFGLCGEKLPDGRPPKVYYVLPGCEVFVYLDEVRRFLLHIDHSLRFSIAFGFATDVVREYAEEFLRALSGCFPDTHPVYNKSVACEQVLVMIESGIAPGHQAIKQILPLIDRCYEAIQGNIHDAFAPTDPWVAIDLPLARRETMIEQSLFWPKFLPLPENTGAQELNAFLRSLDEKEDGLEVLEILRNSLRDRTFS